MQRSKIALLHIPKTGGRALGRLVFRQTRDDETYYFSFFGTDDSQGANRIVVERLHKGDDDHQALLKNRHFLESRVIAGHFSYDIRNMLDGFSLQFATVLREPVSRCISNIYQYTADLPDQKRLGAFEVPSKTKDPAGYRREVHSILTEFRAQAIPGLFPHESMMFQNGLCHMIGGTPLHTYTSEVNFERARQNLAVFARPVERGQARRTNATRPCQSREDGFRGGARGSPVTLPSTPIGAPRGASACPQPSSLNEMSAAGAGMRTATGTRRMRG